MSSPCLNRPPGGPECIKARGLGQVWVLLDAPVGQVLPSLPSSRDLREEPSSGLELKKGVDN